MKAWRILRGIHARTPAQAFNGEGAARADRRWNSRHTRIAYASTTIALAMLEFLTHFEDRAEAPDDLVLVGANVPEKSVDDGVARAPSDWDAFPPPNGARTFGDTWVAERRSLALIVPAVVLPRLPVVEERNILINPLHPRFRGLTYEGPFRIRIDGRLAG
jgi:RES domain-containing protein